MITCATCGHESSATFRFCPVCGTALAGTPGPTQARKVVTVIFSDLTGSTALGEALDSETVRTIMARYFSVLRQALERHGGTVEKFIGDAVMAVFGIPHAREDDALRAVRAAAEMRIAVHTLNEELEREFGITIGNRTGTNTGEVVTGDPGAAGALVTGDTVNTAARLEQAAPPNEILLGALTFELVRDAVSDRRSQAEVSMPSKTSPQPNRTKNGYRGSSPSSVRMRAAKRASALLDLDGLRTASGPRIMTSPAILGGEMCDRDEGPLDLSHFRRALGDAGMWALVPLLLLLGGGFLLFISIFADEFLNRWDFYAGGFAAVLGLAFAALMGNRGCIVAPVLIAVGVFGGWVWEQSRDGGSISAVTYVGGGYDGSHWVGHVHNYEERAATVTCQLEALGPEGDVIGTVEVAAADVRPNGGQFVEGEIDVPPRPGADVRAERITPHRNLRGTCTTEIG